jgi:uncharacterized membrane protein
MHLTLRLGDSEFLIRLNSVIFGTLTIFIFYHLVRLAFNNEVAIFSSILLAVSRFHIHFSQEARLYSLFCLLTTLSFLCLWLYLNQGKRKFLLFLLITDLALLYTHYFGIYVIFSHGLYLFFQIITEQKPKSIKEGIKSLYQPFLGFLLIGFLYIPWLPVLNKQIERQFNAVPNTLTFLRLTNFNKIFIRLSWSDWPSFPVQPGVIEQFILDKFQAIFNTPWPKSFFGPIEIIFPILGILGIIYFLVNQRYRKSTLFFCSWLLIPLVFHYIIYIHWETRYFIFILPAYILAIGLGIAGLKEWLTKIWNQQAGDIWVGAISAVLLTVIFSSLISYYYFQTNDDWRAVGKYLEKHAGPEDAVLVLGGNAAFIDYYYQGSAEIVDADHEFRDPDIQDFDDFMGFVNGEGCKWIFISQHTNKLFGNVFNVSTTNVENIEPIRSLLSERFELVDKVYTLRDYKLKENDLPGLYRSNGCNLD